MKTRSVALLCLAAVLGASCLTGCATGRVGQDGRDADMARRFDAARAAYEQGLDAEAAKLFTQAANRAYVCDDLPAIIEAHYSAAVCLMRLRRFDDAFAALALALHAATLTDRAVPSELHLVRARLAYEQNDDQAARRYAELVIGDRTADGAWVTDARGIIGQVALDANDVRAASAALTAMGSPESPHGQAEVFHLRGRIALIEQRFADAAQAFDRESDLRRQTRSYFAMAVALAHAAQAYERLGESDEAATRYLRAGRSARRQGATEEAARWLERAAELAQRAGDQTTAEYSRHEMGAVAEDTAGHGD